MAQLAKTPAAKPEFKACGPIQQKVRIKLPQAVPLSSARHTYTPKYKVHTRKPMKNNNDKKFKIPLPAKLFRLYCENACSVLKIRHKGLSAMLFAGIPGDQPCLSQGSVWLLSPHLTGALGCLRGSPQKHRLPCKSACSLSA